MGNNSSSVIAENSLDDAEPAVHYGYKARRGSGASSPNGGRRNDLVSTRDSEIRSVQRPQPASVPTVLLDRSGRCPSESMIPPTGSQANSVSIMPDFSMKLVWNVWLSSAGSLVMVAVDALLMPLRRLKAINKQSLAFGLSLVGQTAVIAFWFAKACLALLMAYCFKHKAQAGLFVLVGLLAPMLVANYLSSDRLPISPELGRAVASAIEQRLSVVTDHALYFANSNRISVIQLEKGEKSVIDLDPHLVIDGLALMTNPGKDEQMIAVTAKNWNEDICRMLFYDLAGSEIGIGYNLENKDPKNIRVDSLTTVGGRLFARQMLGKRVSAYRELSLHPVDSNPRKHSDKISGFLVNFSKEPIHRELIEDMDRGQPFFAGFSGTDALLMASDNSPKLTIHSSGRDHLFLNKAELGAAGAGCKGLFSIGGEVLVAWKASPEADKTCLTRYSLWGEKKGCRILNHREVIGVKDNQLLVLKSVPKRSIFSRGPSEEQTYQLALVRP